MDIICKVCNHEINDHLPDGCFHCENGTQSVNETCSCELSPADVANVEITLLQARLDTNRAQVEALITERDALKDYQRDCQEELENRREQYLTAIDQLIKTENERDALKAALTEINERRDL